MAGLTNSSPREEAKDPVLGLESVLAEMIGLHEQMLLVAAAHRVAISGADGHAVQSSVEQMGVLAARVAELELQRRAIVATFAKTSRGEKPTMSMIASNLPEAPRQRVMALASRLRDLLQRLRKEMAVIKAATQSLVAHMDGLMQHVTRALSRTRLYDPRGRIDAGAATTGGLDVTH